MRATLALCVLSLGTGAELVQKVQKDCDIDSLGVGDECKMTWSALKPVLHATQNMLGVAWVMFKHDKYMGSAKDAQKELDNKVVPVVKGPDDVLYCLDHHHLLSALDYAGADLASSVKPTIHVVCDFSGATSSAAFWKQMEPHMYAYGRKGQDDLPMPLAAPDAAFPTRIEFNETGTPFMDDTWRSLAGFTRKLDDAPGCDDAAGQNHNYGCRCYDKVCDASGHGVPFFEFRWGYLYNVAGVGDRDAASLWPSASDEQAFLAAKAALPYPLAPGEVDSDPWFAAAKALFPLARGAAAGRYEVPVSMGFIAGKLPGYKGGDEPFDADDPDCLIPSCNAWRA